MFSSAVTICFAYCFHSVGPQSPSHRRTCMTQSLNLHDISLRSGTCCYSCNTSVLQYIVHSPVAYVWCYSSRYTAVYRAKARDSYIARLTVKPDQPRFTTIEVAVGRQEPMVLQR